MPDRNLFDQRLITSGKIDALDPFGPRIGVSAGDSGSRCAPVPIVLKHDSTVYIVCNSGII